LFDRSSRRLDKMKRSYFKERCEQRQRVMEEFSKLCALLEEKSIDEGTFQRLKTLLKMGYEQERQKTRLKYGFA
jgi:hypothetical protein